jgi:hypothetical protein
MSTLDEKCEIVTSTMLASYQGSKANLTTHAASRGHLHMSSSLAPPPISYVANSSTFDNHQPLIASTPFIANIMPNYIHKYPQISDAIQQVQSIIDQWKSETQNGSFELEARFGRWKGQYFESGVTKAFIEKVLEMFQTYPQWSTVTDWEETHDYFYNSDTTSKGLIRTTASFRVDEKSESGRKSIVTHHIRKHALSKFDFQYKTSQLLTPKFQFDIRVNLNFEERVLDHELPSIVNPSSMRIKSRKSFYYKSDNFPATTPLWKFDITRSWTAATRSDAEMKQKNGETTFEFELECLNPRALMLSPKHDSWYVACSLLMKMRDFMIFANNSHSKSTNANESPSFNDFKWEPVRGFSSNVAPGGSTFN